MTEGLGVEYRSLIERFIAQHFPAAAIAVVAGSTARGTRAATSDIDLLVIGDALFEEVEQESFAGALAFAGETVEVFAYTPSGFTAWAERGFDQHRPVIVEMLLDGVEVRGGALLERLRSRWGPAFAAGPSVDPHELALRRYAITDLLDDLTDSTDALERQVIAALLLPKTAELMLLAAGRWIGGGKNLARRLRDLDRERAEALVVPYGAGDLDSFAERVEHELTLAGGRVREGFTR